MGRYTRLVYVVPSKLIPLTKDLDVEFCYLPLCRICGKYLLYKIAIIKSEGSPRRRYICMQCALRVYPKGYVISLIKEHIRKLSKGRHSRGYVHIYRKLLHDIMHDNHAYGR
jgi:hypothetical protein